MATALIDSLQGSQSKKSLDTKQSIWDSFMVYGDNKWGKIFEIRATAENVIACICRVSTVTERQEIRLSYWPMRKQVRDGEKHSPAQVSGAGTESLAKSLIAWKTTLLPTNRGCVPSPQTTKPKASRKEPEG